MGCSWWKGAGVTLGTAIPSTSRLAQEILEDEQRKCQDKCHPGPEGESSHDNQAVPEDLPFFPAGVLHQK